MEKISNPHSSIDNQIKELTNISLNKKLESIFGFMANLIFIVFIFSCFFGWAILAVLLVFYLSWPLVSATSVENITTILSILNFLTPIFIITIIILLFVWGIYTMKWIYEKCNLIKRIQISITLLHEKLQDTLTIQEDISWIIILIHEIKENIRRIQIILKFHFLFSDSGKSKLKKIWLLSTDIALSILSNLRSDLQARIDEQQQSLEQAKSEVSEHIHWTTELNQISNLQRVRLNRQIEQFEELQRVLMKV